MFSPQIPAFHITQNKPHTCGFPGHQPVDDGGHLLELPMQWTQWKMHWTLLTIYLEKVHAEKQSNLNIKTYSEKKINMINHKYRGGQMSITDKPLVLDFTQNIVLILTNNNNHNIIIDSSFWQFSGNGVAWEIFFLKVLDSFPCSMSFGTYILVCTCSLCRTHKWEWQKNL